MRLTSTCDQDELRWNSNDSRRSRRSKKTLWPQNEFPEQRLTSGIHCLFQREQKRGGN